jgi:hypothetical protein
VYTGTLPPDSQPGALASGLPRVECAPHERPYPRAARRADPRGEGFSVRGRRHVVDARRRAARHPAARRDGRPLGRARPLGARPGGAVDLLPVRLVARRDLRSRARAPRRRGHRRRGARQGCAGAARPDGEHPSLAARGPQLRVLLRGSTPLGATRGGIRRGRAGPRCRRVRQALRLQRLRVRAPHDQLRGGAACDARDLPAALRGGRRGIEGVVVHGRLQQAERHLRLRAPLAPRRPARRRVGLRRRRHLRLVRDADLRALGERRARSRDAGAAAPLRRRPAEGGAGGRGAGGAARRDGHALAAPAGADGRAERRAVAAALHRPARAPRARARGGDRLDGAGQE